MEEVLDTESDAYLERELREWARVDMDTFCTVVMRDEQTGMPLESAPVHSSWHSLAEEHDRLLIWAAIEHGKSTNLSVARPLWLLGNDPTLRIAIVSNTARQAEKLMRSISRYVESSAELHSVFPGLRKGDQWTSSAITVKRPNISKDPSIQCLGVHGNITGARLDYVIIDDLLDVENTRTAKAREDCFEFIQAKLLSRLTARGRVLVVGTAFHPDDALHRMARLPGWKAFRYPVLEDDGQTPRWPERWPMERIARRREELGPLEFARQLLCVARDDSEARFKKEWIDRCLARGDGKNMCYGLDKIPPGYKTYTGVDLAVQQKDGSDFTVLFTIAVAPNGDREVLNVDRGKWSGPDIVARIVDTHRRYQSIVMVENNGAQDFILQFAKGAQAVPLRAFTTGRQKAHPEFGVESIAAEMAAARWIIPSLGGQPLHSGVNQWIQEMLFYSPSSHTGDCIMASWFAREACRQGEQKVHGFSIGNMAR